MKKHVQRAGLIVSIIIFSFQTSNVAAQVVTFAQSYSNSEIQAQIYVSNNLLKREYYLQHPTAADLKLQSNAMLHLPSSKPWPTSFNKQEVLKHCVDILRSSIDTNQVDIACAKLTNQPEEALNLKKVCNVALSDLNEMANLLTNADLSAYIYEGYQAELFTPTNYFGFYFFGDRQPKVVSEFQMRTLDEQQVLISARFYEDGKLMHLANRIDKMSIYFNENGSLRNYGLPNQNIWIP